MQAHFDARLIAVASLPTDQWGAESDGYSRFLADALGSLGSLGRARATGEGDDTASSPVGKEMVQIEVEVLSASTAASAVRS